MKRLPVIIMLLAFSASFSYAVDTASHAITLKVTDACRIGLSSTADLALEIAGPSTGGVAPSGNTDASKSLRYTSLVPSGGSRKITVNWGATDEAPAGTSLLVSVANIPANGGVATGSKKIGGEPQDIITHIGSCATGSATSQVALFYSFLVDDVNRLIVGDTKTITVHFTLTDAW